MPLHEADIDGDASSGDDDVLDFDRRAQPQHLRITNFPKADRLFSLNRNGAPAAALPRLTDGAAGGEDEDSPTPIAEPLAVEL